MDGVSALGAGVVAWTEIVDRATRVRVHDMATKQTSSLDAYDGFGVRDVSADGERLALVGPWRKGKGGNVTELVVVAWRTGERIYASTEHLHYRAVFDPSGERLLVEIYGKKNRGIDLASGRVLGETQDKHVGLAPNLRDDGQVWLPPVAGRNKKRAVWDFSASKSLPAPSDVDIVSPTGALYRIDASLTRLGADHAPIWSRPASEDGPAALLTVKGRVAFSGDDTRVLYEHPDKDGGWGVLHVVDAATGEEVATRRRERGECFELPWPGRAVCDPNRARVLSLDDLTWRDLPELR